MKKIPWILFVVALLCFSQACRRTSGPASKNRGRITAESVDVKKTRATLSPTVVKLHRGEEVEVLSREQRWLRIRTMNRQEGWIEENTAMDQSIIDAEKKLADEVQKEVVQAVGELSSASNLHTAPGRDTPVFARVPKDTKIEVFDRTLTDRPQSPGGTSPTPSAADSQPRKDPWLKVKTEKGDVGWVYSPSVNFSVPDEIVQYSESRRIVAWLPLNQITLEGGKKVNQYVVADVEPGVAHDYDFDRIRVFTWNMKRNRYETAYRESKIFGVYPIRTFTKDDKPAFEIIRLNDANQDSPKITERYVMIGVLVRRLDENQRPAPTTSQRHRRKR
jgi:SH3-like domain-containing protein